MTFPSAFRDARLPVRVSVAPALVLLAALAALFFALPTGSASAVGPEGVAKFKFSYGKAGKALNRQGVRLSPVAASAFKSKKNRRLDLSLEAKAVSVGTGPVAKVKLKGALKLSKGRRSVRIKNFALKADPDDIRINAKVGGKVRTVFATRGSQMIDPSVGSLVSKWSGLRLSKGMARTLKKRLKLKRVPAAKVGSFSARAQAAFEDPYLEQCGLAASSISAPTAPEAGDPLPLGGVATSGDPIAWGFKTSFNGYVNGIGKIEVLDGVTKSGPPFPGAPPTSFGFIFEAGEYAANGAGAADDQAVLNGSGRVVYCNVAHGFRITISDPSVVIDGSDSRIIATVNTNISGDLMPDRRVHLADLDFTDVEIDDSAPGAVEWTFPDVRPSPQASPTDSAVTLSQDGSEALRLCEVSAPGSPPGCLYPPGTLLNALTVRAVFPTS